jgi:hypothetical protein
VDQRPLICGFLKVRDEVLREGNVYRALGNLRAFCDVIVACDDGSLDGTREYLQEHIPPDHLICVPYAEQDFRKELHWKQRMMEIVHRIRPQWVWWHDGDEELDADGLAGIREWCLGADPKIIAGRCHYTQLWRTRQWARTDDSFDDGWFIKLWRYSPELSFDVRDGTHHNQFPRQITEHAHDPAVVVRLPWEVIHWGNYGKNLQWKCIQYWGGLGGVERHLSFEHATFRPAQALPTNADGSTDLAAAAQTLPQPFSEVDKTRIRNMCSLRGLEDTFTVIIPAYNRADTLPATLASLVAQTYPKWVAVVLDDGSTDDTAAVMAKLQAADPRIFYARYPEHAGAVAVNEIGMDLACAWSSWWTRLGSDDLFLPEKLMLDAVTLRDHEACYGPFQVLRNGALEEIGNIQLAPQAVKDLLLGGRFAASWANCAVRTSVLRKVKAVYGSYCDERLQNMEDFLINARIARFADWVWRGEGLMVVTNTQIGTGGLRPDAIWRCVTTGASGNTDQTAKDDALTRDLIASENAAWAQAPSTGVVGL